MEEMLKKFYKEYADRYAKHFDASNMLDVVNIHTEIFNDDDLAYWKKAFIRHYAAVRELRRVAKIFGIPDEKLEEIENSVIDNLC